MFFNPFKNRKHFITPEDRKELLQTLDAIKATVEPETELIYSYFESVEKLLEELDVMIEAVKTGELEVLETLSMHFAPTSGFQELSLQNGWSEEYLKLADRFDRICEKYK